MCLPTGVGGGGGGRGVQRRLSQEWTPLLSVVAVREWVGLGEERKTGEWRR